eukprot:12916739-Prorocentrum_lima.AAC.1
MVPNAFLASRATTTAFGPRRSTPACKTLYCVSAPPGLVANWRCPPAVATLSRRARVAVVRKTRLQALRMLIGRRPPFGFLRATTRAVLSHSYAKSGALPRIQKAAIS